MEGVGTWAQEGEAKAYLKFEDSDNSNNDDNDECGKREIRIC